MLRQNMHEQKGQSLVELAILMPIFSLLIVGGAEFARLAYAAIEVSNAAHAGVQYGAQSYLTAMDTTGMQRAATNDGPDITSLQATATKSCTCTNGTSITCATAPTKCVSPARVLGYVQVNTTAVVNPLFHLPGLPKTYTLHGQATLRVEQ